MPPRGPPSKPEQLEYLIQWFLEYSDVQKDDFLLILVEKFSLNDESALSDSLKILNMTDQPPSIFQCRMKLFNEWFANWSDEEKTELLNRVGSIDEKFLQRFHDCTDVIPENQIQNNNETPLENIQNEEEIFNHKEIL